MDGRRSRSRSHRRKYVVVHSRSRIRSSRSNRKHHRRHDDSRHGKYRDRSREDNYHRRDRSRSRRSRKKPHHKDNYNRRSSRRRSRRTQTYSERSSSESPEYPHYKFRTGDVLGRKYKVRQLLGDGTFGRVVEAEYDNRIYAVKIIKAVSRYIESAKTEKSIVRYVNSRDPEDRQGIVRFVQSFHHYNNYCLVFKPLGKSLYEVIKQNKYRGFPLRLVQSFFRQILRSVGFLHSVGYTHTDLKPENVLLEENRFARQESNGSREPYLLPENDRVRIIDFGGATEVNQHHSRTINTRQYRSPEVILGCCEWDHVSDVWSIGCIVVELLTGELFFETHQNVEHLRMIERHAGSLPDWMVNRSSEFRGSFRDGRVDWPRLAANDASVERVHRMKLLPELMPNQPQLVELLRRCLEVDPRRRVTCQEALRHRFFELQF